MIWKISSSIIPIGRVVVVRNSAHFVCFRTRKAKKQDVSLKTGLLIGCAQAFAIIPGISRSGSTIGAAIALGISREEAARFSFLMALPVIFGATALELIDLYQDGIGQGAAVSWQAYALGAAAAFTSGWVACNG